MTLTINSSCSQPNASKNIGMNAESADNEILKGVLENVMKEKGEYDGSNLNWVDNDTVEVSCLSSLAIHSFVLKAEQLGKDVTYEKRVVIKITD